MEDDPTLDARTQSIDRALRLSYPHPCTQKASYFEPRSPSSTAWLVVVMQRQLATLYTEHLLKPVYTDQNTNSWHVGRTGEGSSCVRSVLPLRSLALHTTRCGKQMNLSLSQSMYSFVLALQEKWPSSHLNAVILRISPLSTYNANTHPIYTTRAT